MSDYTRQEISAVIYECVSRTELQDMDRERVKMMLDICDNMRDHDFRTETITHKPLQQTGSDGVRIRSSRAAAVCLVLLCVLLLTAVIVLCVHIQTKSTNCTQEREQLLTKITNFTKEREQLLNKITKLTEERDELLTRDNCFKKKMWELSDMDLQGWRCNGFDCYYISCEKKNWAESRRDCKERGADLIIINNREEQDYVNNISDGVQAWIGLTDSDVEDTWKWVDGTNMTSGFWMKDEPSGQRTENCVLTAGEWADHPCTDEFTWICEKFEIYFLGS